ncbi:hypothetical protein ASPZODRAFT_28230 [Penicilliopsis zonata CBS 506.65]|uniref:HNH nuclease domain-containing protein n=1 Tax=Penicilliopsis zonata CBS 506.65 TaxID=1073090 RepID=A0A1L9S8T4_9EURO|nr:hypothetical protein ASPZODRAFT_28230 [Penicilliopsis zonata CBS 506.65]OJJ43568.1 hypothetical protein ASPZODRAFT_28230 [Penicilliopsis zonata CBS 506.65]
MADRKGKRRLSNITPNPPPVTRRSRRLMGQSPNTPGEEEPPQPLRAASREMSTISGLSAVSTQPGQEPWAELKQRAKARITSYKPARRANDDKLQDCLRCFIDILPADGQESIARDIADCQTDEDLWRVYHNLLTGLLLPIKAASRTPSVTLYPHTRRQRNADIVASTFPDESELRVERFRKACLERDSQRCVISGVMDIEHWEKIGFPRDIESGHVEGAHIIPFSFGSWEGKTLPDDAGPKWEVLVRCFPAVRRLGMRPETINDPCNGLTMFSPLHMEFGSFQMAFKETDTPHRYLLKTYRRFSTSLFKHIPQSPFVELTSTTGDTARPSPVLLNCHFYLAEILNVSGMSEYIEEKIQDWESLKLAPGAGQLRADGSTDVSRYLQAGLWSLVSVS